MRSEESLSRFENHLIIYFEQFIDEQPSAICAQSRAVAVLENPVALFIGDATLNSRERVVVELDIAVRHPSYSNLS